MITQLAYYSRNKAAGDDRALLGELRQILKVSQANNSRDGVTGFLIFDKTWFIQILEGDGTTVQATYNRIQKDDRHGAVVLIGKRDVQARSFPAWSMGGAMRTPEQQEVYLRHGVGGAIDPAKLTASGVIALALDLQDFEARQKSAARSAA